MTITIAAEPTIEHVLCVPTLLFHEIGYFQGFQADVDRYLRVLLDPMHTSFRPRNEVETDPSYKQLIPYCIFRHEGQIFHYRRGKAGGEGRLHSKRSIGIGGHISSTDRLHGDRRYFEAMHREISEEVFLESGFRDACVGLINDDQTPVGQVHLGIVHIFDLDSAKVRPREESILETGFASPAELAADLDGFETWSQICLREALGLRLET
jgi:predicted NUDIX family phosphoesterase